MITVWIAITYFHLVNGDLAMATSDKYAFKDKNTCELMIKNIADIKCIELKVIGND